MLSTGEEIRSPQRSSRSGPILAKMPCTIDEQKCFDLYLSLLTSTCCVECGHNPLVLQRDM